MISKLTSDLKKNWKVFLIAVGLMLIADSIGPFSITLPFGKVSMFPLFLQLF